ncbi:hypothetical protein, partial [Acidaminococcus intestini]|uniref:hypothetical protein n=1 Tax=Acidaminococcus intestini TaxID=187327 RepID=UPI003AB883A6
VIGSCTLTHATKKDTHCIQCMSSPGVHRHFSTPKFDKEPKYRVVIGKEIVDKNKKIDEQNCKNKGACLPCFDDEKA